MSLHDVDKGGNRRNRPALNAPDRVENRSAHNTTGITNRKDTDTNKQRVAFKNGVILYYDDQDRIIRVDGFIPSVANYPVTIIAKYGYDVYLDILGIDRPVV